MHLAAAMARHARERERRAPRSADSTRGRSRVRAVGASARGASAARGQSRGLGSRDESVGLAAPARALLQRQPTGGDTATPGGVQNVPIGTPPPVTVSPSDLAASGASPPGNTTYTGAGAAPPTTGPAPAPTAPAAPAPAPTAGRARPGRCDARHDTGDDHAHRARRRHEHAARRSDADDRPVQRHGHADDRRPPRLSRVDPPRRRRLPRRPVGERLGRHRPGTCGRRRGRRQHLPRPREAERRQRPRPRLRPVGLDDGSSVTASGQASAELHLTEHGSVTFTATITPTPNGSGGVDMNASAVVGTAWHF